MKSVKQVTFGVLPLFALCGSALAGPRLFVPNYGQDIDGQGQPYYSVSVFDQANLPPQNQLGTTQTEVDPDPSSYPYVDRISVGPNPVKVACSPDGRWAFSANSGSTGSDGVTWFSAQLPYTVYQPSIATGAGPKDIAVARKSTGDFRVVTANHDGGSVTFFQPTESHQITGTATVTVTGVGGVAAQPETLCNYSHALLGGATSYVYVASSYTNRTGASVSYFDTNQATPTAQGTFALPTNPVRAPKSMAISYDARFIWIASAARDALGNETNIGYVDIYNRATRTLVRTFGPFNNLQGLGVALNGKVSLDPRSSKAYVSFSSSTAGYVYIFRIQPNGTIETSYTVKSVGPGAQGLDVAPDDSSVWIANRYDNTLSIINGSTDDAVTEPPVSGSTPTRIRGGDGTVGTAQPLVQPYSVTFVPEDLRTFNTSIYGYDITSGWTMYGGGSSRRGVARSPLDELLVADPVAGTYPGTTDPAWKAWAAIVPDQGYQVFQGASPVYANASPAAYYDTVVVPSYIGDRTGGVRGYAVTGTGSGQPVLRWVANTNSYSGGGTGTYDDFLATPVIMDTSQTGSGGIYAICVSVDGHVYAVAVSTYYLYDNGQTYTYSPGQVIWHTTLRSTEGYFANVISSPVRYQDWIYVTVGWKNGAGGWTGCGLVRFQANPYYSSQYGGWMFQNQDYFRATENIGGYDIPIARRVYSSPAVVSSGSTAGIVFGVPSSNLTQDYNGQIVGLRGYVFDIPVQTSVPVANPTWTSTIIPGGPGGFVTEIGSPSVAYGKVFIGTHGTSTAADYALDASTGTQVWGQDFMTTGDCGSLHAPAVFDGMVQYGYDGGSLYSRLAETGDINPRWGSPISIGNGEYLAPIITTSGTILEQVASPTLYGVNLQAGATLFNPDPRRMQSVSLPGGVGLGASPAVIYVKSTRTQDPLSGRWTFTLSSNGDGTATLQSVFKNFQW